MVTKKTNIEEAWADIASGLTNWRIWTFLGWTDILLRYRRTIIGPFWMTISTGVMIATMGVVWGIIFNAHLPTFLPYLAAGLVTWFMMSTIMTESTNAISDRPDSLKDFNLPISYTAFRLVVRNFIVFLHNVIIYFAVALIFGTNFFTTALPLVLLGLFLLLLNAAWVSIFLGIIGARFRDIQQLVATVMTILFLASPILWQQQALGNNQFIATFNPVTHFVDIVRAPLLGHPPPLLSFAVIVCITIAGWTATLLLLARARRRIVFWL
jgi:ABC-type polysaccharide/polyol phosphate export permease